MKNEFLFLLWRLFKWSNFRYSPVEIETYPGPKPHWPVGNALDFSGHDPYKILKKYNDLFGQNVLFWILKQPNFLLTKPDDIKAVLQEHVNEFYKNSPKKAAGDYFLSSAFFANGQEWKTQRKAHFLEKKSISEIFDNVVQTARSLSHSHCSSFTVSKNEQELLLFDEITKLSFNIFSHIFLGRKATSELFKLYLVQMEDMHRKGTNPLSIPAPLLKRRTRSWQKELEGMLKRTMQKEKGGSTTVSHDLPSWLTEKDFVSAENVISVRDEISTSFYAGTRNVASAISFLIGLVASHESEYASLEASVDEFLKKYPDGYTYENLQELEYLDRALSEALRLYPTVPVFFREVLPGRSKVELPTIVLPEKAQVFISSWVTHRDPDLWHSPNEFRPARFNEKPAEFSYFPFGAGERECVGKELTKLISKTVVIELIRHCTFTSLSTPNDSHIDNEYFAGIVIPSDGLAINVKARV